MDQYIEYMKSTIIETITHTTDTKMLQIVYGLLMEDKTNQVEYPSAS
jgi:hypothetical protein